MISFFQPTRCLTTQTGQRKRPRAAIVRYGDNSAGGPDHDVLTGASSEVSLLFQCYISHYIQVPVKRRAGGFCQQLFPANTLRSQSDDNTFALWRGVKRKLAVAERESMCVWKRRVTRVDVEGKQRKINSYSVSLVSSVEFSSSCCHLLEIITERNDRQVKALPFYLYTMNVLKSSRSYLILIINIFYIKVFFVGNNLLEKYYFTLNKNKCNTLFFVPIFHRAQRSKIFFCLHKRNISLSTNIFHKSLQICVTEHFFFCWESIQMLLRQNGYCIGEPQAANSNGSL